MAGFIASLKVTVTTVDAARPDVRCAGDTETTVGGVMSGADDVVKVAVAAELRRFPARSFAPAVTFSRYATENESGEVGVRVAVFVAAL